MATGAMVITDQDGSVGSEASGSAECEQPGDLHGARRLRGKVTNVMDGVKEPDPELGLRSGLDLTIWSSLPTELLPFVLARLALSEIPRVRFLSNEWKTSMATANSVFNRACDEANPRMVALLFKDAGRVWNKFWVRIFDLNKNTWYRYFVSPWGGIDPQTCGYWGMTDACDGGLVCFIGKRDRQTTTQLHIAVLNPLTRVHQELPPLDDVWLRRHAMVQITVDSETKCYKVIVAGIKIDPTTLRSGGPVAAIYDSRSRQWTKVAQSQGLIFGHALIIRSTDFYLGGVRSKPRIPCAYNFAEGQLELYNAESVSEGTLVKCFKVVKDHLFVLHEEMQRVYCITEYHAECRGKNWVAVKNHRCAFLDYPLNENYVLDLNACGGVLMLSVRRKPELDDFLVHWQHKLALIPFECEYGWLLDLCTGEWRELPECLDREPIEPSLDSRYFVESLMCTASWNVIP